jgi:hypothetical protein
MSHIDWSAWPWSFWAVPKGNADTYALKIHRNSSFKNRRCSKFHRVHAKKVQKWLVLCLGLAELDQDETDWDWQASKCTYALYNEQFLFSKVHWYIPSNFLKICQNMERGQLLENWWEG